MSMPDEDYHPFKLAEQYIERAKTLRLNGRTDDALDVALEGFETLIESLINVFGEHRARLEDLEGRE